MNSIHKSQILFSKPLTVKKIKIPSEFKLVCDEAEVSYKFERKNSLLSVIYPQAVVAYHIIKNLSLFKDNIVITGRYGV